MKLRKSLLILVAPFLIALSSCSKVDDLVTCSIKYDVSGEIVNEERYNYFEKVSPTYEYTYSNGTISSWYFDQECTDIWDGEIELSKDITVYGCKKHRIDYYIGSEHYDVLINHGDSFSLDVGSIPDGYYLEGWYYDSLYSQKLDTHIASSDLELYGKLVKNDYNRIEVEFRNEKEDAVFLYRDQPLELSYFTVRAYYGDNRYDTIDVSDPHLSFDLLNVDLTKAFATVDVTLGELQASTTFLVKDNKPIGLKVKDVDNNTITVLNIDNPSFEDYEFEVKFNYGEDLVCTNNELTFELEEKADDDLSAVYSASYNGVKFSDKITVKLEPELTINELEYSLDANGNIEIFGLAEGVKRPNINIPGIVTLNGKECKVISVKSSAFKGNQDIVSVTLPDTLKVVDANAFEGCTNLNSVTYYGNNLQVKNEAFKNCSSLKELPFLNKLIKINKGVLSGCSSLERVNFNYQLKEIGDNAFLGCSKLTSVDLNNVVKVGANAFAGCSELKKIDLSKLNNIGASAFAQTAIKTISLNDSVVLGSAVFENDISVTDIINKSSYSLEDIFGSFVPTSIKNITISKPKVGCLNKLTYVETLKIENFNDLTLGQLFSNSPVGSNEKTEQNGLSFYIPTSLKELNVTSSSLNASAFENCKNITSIEIRSLGETVDIKNNTFKNCTALSNLDFELENCKNIGDNAFLNCEQLFSVIKLDRAVTVGSSAFENTNASLVNIGGNCISIGEKAFHNISNLRTFNVASINSKYMEYLGVLYEKLEDGYRLIKCPEATQIIPKVCINTREIASLAFYNCSQKRLIIEAIEPIACPSDEFSNSQIKNVYAYNAYKNSGGESSIGGLNINYSDYTTDGPSLFIIDAETNRYVDRILITNNKIDLSKYFKAVNGISDYVGNSIAYTLDELNPLVVKFENGFDEDNIIKVNVSKGTYKVQFIYSNTKSETKEFEFNQTIVYPAEKPVEDQYIFQGWVDQTTKKPYEKMPARDIYLVPSWKESTWYISFATDDNQKVDMIEATAKSEDILLPVLEDTKGKTFIGWGLNKDRTEKIFTSLSHVTEDTVLYPKYASKIGSLIVSGQTPVTITYKMGHNLPDQKVKYQPGETINFEIPSLSGWVFIHWLDDNNKPFKFEGEILEDTTLSAKWVQAGKQNKLFSEGSYTKYKEYEYKYMNEVTLNLRYLEGGCGYAEVKFMEGDKEITKQIKNATTLKLVCKPNVVYKLCVGYNNNFWWYDAVTIEYEVISVNCTSSTLKVPNSEEKTIEIDNGGSYHIDVPKINNFYGYYIIKNNLPIQITDEAGNSINTMLIADGAYVYPRLTPWDNPQ